MTSPCVHREAGPTPVPDYEDTIYCLLGDPAPQQEPLSTSGNCPRGTAEPDARSSSASESQGTGTAGNLEPGPEPGGHTLRISPADTGAKFDCCRVPPKRGSSPRRGKDDSKRLQPGKLASAISAGTGNPRYLGSKGPECRYCLSTVRGHHFSTCAESRAHKDAVDKAFSKGYAKGERETLQRLDKAAPQGGRQSREGYQSQGSDRGTFTPGNRARGSTSDDYQGGRDDHHPRGTAPRDVGWFASRPSLRQPSPPPLHQRGRYTSPRPEPQQYRQDRERGDTQPRGRSPRLRSRSSERQTHANSSSRELLLSVLAGLDKQDAKSKDNDSHHSRHDHRR